MFQVHKVNFKYHNIFDYNWQLKLASKEENEGGRFGKETRKYEIYSGAKCSIVECWFSVNENCFVKCICIQRITYSEYCISIHKLGYVNPCLSSPSENKVTSVCKEKVQSESNAVWLPCFCDAASEQMELLLLTRRRPLH
jgi:hypothetical protein